MLRAFIVSISSPDSLNASINALPTSFAIILVSLVSKAIPSFSEVSFTFTPSLAKSAALSSSSVETYPGSISSSSFKVDNCVVNDSLSTSNLCLVFSISCLDRLE